jgi:hypothetical protein
MAGAEMAITDACHTKPGPELAVIFRREPADHGDSGVEKRRHDGKKLASVI